MATLNFATASGIQVSGDGATQTVTHGLTQEVLDKLDKVDRLEPGSVTEFDVPDATTDTKGILLLATDEDVREGLDNTKAATPSQVKRFGGGGAFPDYANTETINRISTNDGEWTADKDGFVQLIGNNSGVGVTTFKIANKVVYQDTYAHGVTMVHPIKKGQVVKISIAVMGNVLCFFIPPVSA